MKRLLVLRHAKSSWKHEVEDHDRPLNKRGERDAPRMGRLLAAEGLPPGLVLCSTAVRARTTAGLVLEGAGVECELRLDPELYLASPGTIVERLCKVPDPHDTVLVVGHNPGMAELVQGLTGEEVSMPTAALAAIDCGCASWAELMIPGAGRLLRHWIPRELPAES